MRPEGFPGNFELIDIADVGSCQSSSQLLHYFRTDSHELPEDNQMSESKLVLATAK